MGNHLAAERMNEARQGKYVSDRALKEQHGIDSVGSNPAVQLQAAVGNRAMLEILKKGALDDSFKLKSSGAKLTNDVKEKMEASFGTDFSDVTVHESPHAQAIGAQAFAQQNRIHFAPGQYSPASPEGQRLLGHELAHVVQQRQGRVARPKDRTQPVVLNPALEQEADSFGERASRGMPVGSSLTMNAGPSPAPQIDSGAPVQGFVKKAFKKAKKVTKKVAKKHPAMKLGKKAIGGAKKFHKKYGNELKIAEKLGTTALSMAGPKGAIAAGALQGGGGISGVMGTGKSLMSGDFKAAGKGAFNIAEGAGTAALAAKGGTKGKIAAGALKGGGGIAGVAKTGKALGKGDFKTAGAGALGMADGAATGYIGTKGGMKGKAAKFAIEHDGGFRGLHKSKGGSAREGASFVKKGGLQDFYGKKKKQFDEALA